MEQHPIPQNVSSYQFKLVGDMTLKQFFELAGGFVVGLIFYSAPLIGIIKWPFAIISVILGAAMAFVPFEERPLEQWIFAFFRAIYSPTSFYWRKTAVKTKFFQDEAVGPAPASASAGQEAALKTYLGNKQAQGPLAKFDLGEQGFLATLSGIFAGLKKQDQPIATPVTPQNQVLDKEKRIEIPITTPVKIASSGSPHLVVEEKDQTVIPSTEVTANQVSQVVAGNEIVSTKQAIFSIDAAPPNPPTVSNVIVGQVVDEERKIIEGAIMEIKDELGRPIRALRSNKLGHFVTVTPLDDGRYSVVTEKDEYQFAPVSFDAAGSLIPPILVQGKKINLNQTVPTEPATNQLNSQTAVQS